MPVFLVIPAYNEEENISRVLAEARGTADKIILVDDGSSDKTSERAKSENVEIIRHAVNRGQGAALETGNRLALAHGADIIVHFDADGQFFAREIDDLVKPLKEKRAEVAFGSRFLGKNSRLPRLKKYFLIPLAHLVNRIFIGATLTDPQCGFRALTRQAAERIRIEQDRMAHCTEIIAKVIKMKIPFVEVPVSVEYRTYGQKFFGGLKIVRDLFFGVLLDN